MSGHIGKIIIVIIPIYDLHKVLKLHVQQHKGLFATVLVAILSPEFISTLDQKPSCFGFEIGCDSQQVSAL